MLKNNHKYTDLPEEIVDYRDQSWQIEILIAGGTVLTLASITDNFRHLFFQYFPITDFSHYMILLIFAAYISTRVLLIGFIANLILRAVWLAYLGINFSFPKGIDYDHVGGSEESKTRLRSQPAIIDRVLKLERYCNLSYSLAILLALITTSAFASLVVVTLLLQLLGAGSWVEESLFAYIFTFFIISTQLGLFDRLLFRGKETTRKKQSKVRKTVSKILGFISLSFLFRREILVIKSNTKKWITFLISLTILVLATVISANQIGKYWPYGTLKISFADDREYYHIPFIPRTSNSNYDTDLHLGKIAFKSCIPQQIVEGPTIPLFIVYWENFDDFLGKKLKENNYPLGVKAKTRIQNDSLRRLADLSLNTSLNSTLNITIDGQKANASYWRKKIHPETKEEGYHTYIDIQEVTRGPHSLKIFMNYYDNDGKQQSIFWDEILFIKK